MDALIFGRTQKDVTSKTSKGYWNVSDLARIKEWVDYLSTEFDLGLTTDAAILGEQANIPQVVDNVEAIRSGHTWSWTPTTPNFISWNYIKANSVERILYDANHHEQSRKDGIKYCGMAVTGQGLLY